MKTKSISKASASSDWVGLSARIAIGVILFPHGVQKLFGYWGGLGYEATMAYFTQTLNLPSLLGLLVIGIEFFLPLLLVFGLFTRASAAIIGLVMMGIIVKVQHQYFFMNWFGSQKGEGMEFFLLMIGLCLVCLFNGGGKYAVDHYLKHNKHEEQ